MTTTLEPRHMLDATMQTPFGDDGVVVNEPKDDVLDKHAIWRAVEDAVRRLRQRIFTHGLLEPCALKGASTVLRGPGRSNAPRLPDVRHEVAHLE
jgi:hypothetical protein